MPFVMFGLANYVLKAVVQLLEFGNLIKSANGATQVAATAAVGFGPSMEPIPPCNGPVHVWPYNTTYTPPLCPTSTPLAVCTTLLRP